MIIEVQFWQLVTLLISFFGAAAGALKLMFAQHQKHLDMRFSTLESVQKKESANWQRVERELMNLKAELPINYVRREDYIRGQSILEAKLDGLANKIENAQLRGLIAGEKKHGH